MEKGHFYFISESYFVDFPDDKLMRNKEVIDGVSHNRPTFFAFEEADGIFWMIPVSSQVLKFKSIYRNKIQKSGNCDTIAFGDVLGYERAFLIQNMCPITLDYISNEYVSNEVPVKLKGDFEIELIRKAKKVLTLVRNGHSNLVFPDILSIEKKLKSK